MANLSLFNSIWYLQQNPDVAGAVSAGLIDAKTHFELYGANEGRSPSPLFDPQDYLTSNPDVAQAVRAGLTTAFDHFMQFGVNEGRSPTSLFNEALYLQQNPDVAEAVEAGWMNPVQHLLLYGASEDRVVNPAIHLGLYMDANTDVRQVVANDVMSALEHLIMYGVRESRDLGNGVSLGQFKNDPVFQQALSSGDAWEALTRVNDVAPFIPTFQRPSGWSPAADIPIPTDFVPTSGFKLVVPPEVKVPPGTVLSDDVFKIEQPGGPTAFSDAHTVSVDADSNSMVVDFKQALSNNTESLDALKDAITVSIDGITFVALTIGDTVDIVNGNLVVTFQTLPVSDSLQFNIDSGALKNASGSSNSKPITTSVLDNKTPAIANVAYADNSDTVTLTYTEALRGAVEAGDFVVTLQDDSTVLVNSAVIGEAPNANQITLTLAGPVAADTVKTVSYDAGHGTANSIVDTSGNAAASQIFNAGATIGGNPNTTTLTYSQNVGGAIGSEDFTDNPANVNIAVNDRFTVPKVTAFTPTTQIPAPDTFSGWGDDLVHDNQFEVFYGKYDAGTKIFTVTSTPTVPDLLGATHTFILYDNDTESNLILDGLLVAGAYSENQWYVGGDLGARFLAYDALAETVPYYLSQSNALYGTDAAETIDGQGGGDVIIGGGGADTLTGGAGIDAFIFSRSDSVLDAMDTITDYRASGGSNGGALDIITLTDVEAVVSPQQPVVMDLNSQADLASAVNFMASSNEVDEGLLVFVWGGDTYAYVEHVGSGTEYVETDWVIKISGTPFAVGTYLETLGIDGIQAI